MDIDISRQSDQWMVEDFDITSAITTALKEFDVSQTELSIVLADDTFVQKLNKEYRSKDKPTNVLSFPQDPPMLGDIVLAYETVHREAQDQDKSFDAHFTHLLVHGALHLLGYDHETEDDAQEMEALEIDILSKMGIQNPYEND